MIKFVISRDSVSFPEVIAHIAEKRVVAADLIQCNDVTGKYKDLAGWNDRIRLNIIPVRNELQVQV